MTARRPEVERHLSRAHRAARFVCQRVLLTATAHALMDVRTRGVDLIDVPELREGPYVLVANHTSHLDALLLVTQLPWRVSRDLAFGAAADYFYEGRWRRLAAGLFFNTFPIERGPRRAVTAESARGLAFSLVEAGVPVALFPEGTRSRDGAMGRFTPGAALVSRRGRVPCVPVAVRGAAQLMPAGEPLRPRWPRPTVELIVGVPLHPHTEESVRAYSARIEDAVRAMVSGGVPPRAAHLD